MITLNTPVAQEFPTSVITGFLEVNMVYTFSPGSPGAGTVFVNYLLQGSGVSGAIQTCAPITATAFEALTGATSRVKAMAAIITYLGLGAGTYTVS